MAEVPPNPSNYYRPPTATGPMAPAPGYVSIDAIGAAWRIMQTDWGTQKSKLQTANCNL